MIAFPWSNNHTLSSLSCGNLLRSVIKLSGLPHNRKLLQESGELCSLYNSNPAKPAEVWCFELCAATLFVLLLKFGAVLSIICGFLMAVSCWRRILQCIVIMWSSLRLLKLWKLAVGKLDLPRAVLLVSWCVWPWLELDCISENIDSTSPIFCMKGCVYQQIKNTSGGLVYFCTYRVDLCDTCTPLMHGSHTRCSQLHWLQWKGSDASTAPRMICVHHVFYRGAMTENENLWTHFVPPLFFFLWNVKMSSLPPLTVSLSGQMRELEFYTTDIRYR